MRRNALPLFCGFVVMMVVAIVMAACGAQPKGNADHHGHSGNPDYSVIHMDVDGYRIACVVPNHGTSGTTDCDWIHRKPIE